MSSNAIEEDFEIIQNNVPSVNNTGNEQNWQTSTVRSEQFHKVDKIVQDNPVKPLVLTFNNMQVCAFFRHASMPELDVLSKACRSQWRCETCAGRSRTYGKLSAPSGPVFMSPAILALCKPHMGLDAELYEEMGEATSRMAKAPIIGIRIQRTASIAGHSREAGGFIHWMLPIDENDRTSEKLDEKLVSRLEKACHRYLPKDLPSLVDKLIGDGSATAVQSALDSLNLMETCLHKATYGDRWLGAFRWIRAIVQELKDKSLVPSAMTEAERWGFYARHLLGSNCILEEANDTAVCPFYHTVNGNIVDLLETAHSESAMVAMITERLAPQNYQRRDVTAQLSEGEVNIAMKALGEFRNTIMTVEEAGQLPHAVMLKVSQQQEENSIVAAVSSSIAGFQKMLVGIEKDKASSEETESGDSKKKANSFAARTGNSTDAVEIKKIESVDALLEYLTAHPETKLEIASGQAACYLANTTLPEDARSVPHFWAFTGSTINANQTGAWAEVRVIAPLYKYVTRYKNVIFVTKNEKVTGNFTNCCFPEFLSSKYTRNCGKAFERLNTMEKIGLPEAGVTEAAIGVGTSGQNEKGTFSAIKFKLNGIEISIGKLYI